MIKQVLFEGRVEVGISEIGDGDMRFFNGDENEIITNQSKLGKVIGLEGERAARIRTVYEGREQYTNYYEIADDDLRDYTILKPEAQIPISDGLITKCREVGILLPLADCLGMVVYDERQRIVGLLHAGRHNIEQGGPEKFVRFLVDNYNSDPKDLKVYFSPCALNYEITKLDNKKIPDAAREQLIENGVWEENIIEPGIDTFADERFPSCSAGDGGKRFAVVVKRV